MSQLGLTAIFVVLTFGLYIGIAIWSRVNTTSGFYVAGQGIPSIFNGMATAADWMSAASFLSMAGLIALSRNGFDGAIYLLGWTGGYVLLALLLAPYLRKFGKFTVPEFIGDRYESNAARLVAAVCAIFVSFTYVAGQMRGVGIAFSRFLEIDIVWGVVIGMAIVATYATMGGMKGITWTQVAQYSVLIVAYIVPAIAIARTLTGNPVPQLAFMNVAGKLDQIQTDLGFGAYTSPFNTLSPLNVFLITMALMCGTAGLPHVIIRFYTARSVTGARWTGFWALVFIGLLYTTAPAIAAFAKYNMINTVSNVAYTDVPEWFKTWEGTGLLTFTDRNSDGVIQYIPGAENELRIDNDIMVLANPEIANLPAWIIALVVAGGLAAALSTASGLLLVVASSISHDIYKKFINPSASEANELLVARVAVIFAVIIAGLLGIYPPGFVGEVVAFAFGLAAASFFPAIVLGIFDKRTNRTGAVTGMIVGLVFTAFYIITTAPGIGIRWNPWLFGISPQGIGSVGMLINFVLTYVISRMTEEPSAQMQAFVEGIRYPKGAGSASAHD
ncbi:MAG: cation acetate symporter [Trueperaceae bacterium]|nr:cation acetate symporter [Trueperaceae bacterium]